MAQPLDFLPKNLLVVAAILQPVLEVLDSPVKQVDLVLFLMQDSCVVQKACSLDILAGVVNLFLHESVDFVFQQLQSLLIVEFWGSRESLYLRVAFVSALEREKVVFVPCQVNDVSALRITPRKLAPLDFGRALILGNFMWSEDILEMFDFLFFTGFHNLFSIRWWPCPHLGRNDANKQYGAVLSRRDSDFLAVIAYFGFGQQAQSLISIHNACYDFVSSIGQLDGSGSV